MQSLSARELAAWLADAGRAPPLLLDVREDWEFALCRIAGAALMTLGQLAGRAGELGPARAAVCICHHGVRSALAAHLLAARGWNDVYNLDGGIDAWAREVDRTMPTY